jgi:uncharacterized membrane protein YjjP (DUF1212 family)
VVRLEPGDVDLARLCAADGIAERVLAGEMGLAEGSRALRELKAPSGAAAQALTAFSFGLASSRARSRSPARPTR